METKRENVSYTTKTHIYIYIYCTYTFEEKEVCKCEEKVPYTKHSRIYAYYCTI